MIYCHKVWLKTTFLKLIVITFIIVLYVEVLTSK